jgi:2-furoyl-CoA dehydrogenase large subunit
MTKKTLSSPTSPNSSRQTNLHVGQPLERVEDNALLTGRGQFIDDLGVKPGTLYAAILRSPHAHAKLIAINGEKASALPGVRAILTRDDIKRCSAPFVVGVKSPMECWSLAIDKVRYVGEPVAVVVAESRYIAEDALDLIDVTYEALPAVVDVVRASKTSATVLHEAVGSNVVSDRSFRYGDPESAFENAAHRVTITIDYPRNSCTPIECFGCVAEYLGEDGYDVLSSFMGPFSLHTVMALALKVPGVKLRHRTPPDSGGSFGVKQSGLPYIVLMCLAARKAGAPVKWIEDRLEHLTAATSATARHTTIEAAVQPDGKITALRYDQMDECGAYLRAPEPATFYRMHGALTGAYDIPNLAVRNRVVLTNKTPTGLVRGFGGPQVYFALERLVQRIAVELKLDPIDVFRRNFVQPNQFPYRATAGALLDSGDYHAALAIGTGNTREAPLCSDFVAMPRWEKTSAPHVLEYTASPSSPPASPCLELETKQSFPRLARLRAKQDAARGEGRLYGIGFAAIVEPSISNMGYISTVLTPEARAKAGPKNGAISSATVSIDPLGGVTVIVASAPAGQGHRTVLAQVVADVFGLPLKDIQVNVEFDTQKDAWSVAEGNYSSRFAGAVAGTAHLAAMKLRDKLARTAARQLGVDTNSIVFENGKIFSREHPEKSQAFGRLAAGFHWSPALVASDEMPGLRETVFWSPEQLTAPDADDHVNTSLAYGFVFDICGVEVDRDTGRVRIDEYITTHDAGTLLNPALADGQIRGGFAQAVGAALMEEFRYGNDGAFLSGTFADYLVPTSCEVPEPTILHLETPSPFTPLGAKGLGEGNNMSTPVCIANAVADALSVKNVTLPLTPSKVMQMLDANRPEAIPYQSASPAIGPKDAPGLAASGTFDLNVSPEQIFAILNDPAKIAQVIPGCENFSTIGENHYRADVAISIGIVKVRYQVEVKLSELHPPRSFVLSGKGISGMGVSEGSARIRLAPRDGGSILNYEYGANVSGKVAAIGGRMLESASKFVLKQLFERLGQVASGTQAPAKLSWWQKLTNKDTES